MSGRRISPVVRTTRHARNTAEAVTPPSPRQLRNIHASDYGAVTDGRCEALALNSGALGRDTGTRRPPSVTEPASWPYRVAARSESCLPRGPPHRGHVGLHQLAHHLEPGADRGGQQRFAHIGGENFWFPRASARYQPPTVPNSCSSRAASLSSTSGTHATKFDRESGRRPGGRPGCTRRDPRPDPGPDRHRLRHHPRRRQSSNVLQALLGHKSAVETWDTHGRLMGDEDPRGRAIVDGLLGNGRPRTAVASSENRGHSMGTVDAPSDGKTPGQRLRAEGLVCRPGSVPGRLAAHRSATIHLGPTLPPTSCGPPAHSGGQPSSVRCSTLLRAGFA
jgi:hypothetical protein